MIMHVFTIDLNMLLCLQAFTKHALWLVHIPAQEWCKVVPSIVPLFILILHTAVWASYWKSFSENAPPIASVVD